MSSAIKAFANQRYQFSWSGLGDYALIFTGGLLQALAIRLFLVPANLVSGGVSGLAQIINFYTGWPIGVMIFLGNLPFFQPQAIAVTASSTTRAISKKSFQRFRRALSASLVITFSLLPLPQ